MACFEFRPPIFLFSPCNCEAILSFSWPVTLTGTLSWWWLVLELLNHHRSANIEPFISSKWMWGHYIFHNTKKCSASSTPVHPSTSVNSFQLNTVLRYAVHSNTSQFRSSWYLKVKRCSLPDLGGVRRSSSCQFLFISYFVPLLSAYLFQSANITFSCSWVLNWESTPWFAPWSHHPGFNAFFSIGNKESCSTKDSSEFSRIPVIV